MVRLSHPTLVLVQLARHERRDPASVFAAAYSSASSPQAHSQPLESTTKVDPYVLLKPEITHIRSSLLGLFRSSNSSLSEPIASHYLNHPSKQFGSLLVLLFSRATNGLGSHFPLKLWSAEHSRLSAEQLDAPLSHPDVLNDYNSSMPDHMTSFLSPFDLRFPPASGFLSRLPSLYAKSAVSTPHLSHTLLPTQLRLAQIVEMMHMASLLHDDVTDDFDLRRGAPSVPAASDNKPTILGGDILLGRAVLALSQLGDNEVVELISTALVSLVEGEMLQMRGMSVEASVDVPLPLRSSIDTSGKVDLARLHAAPSHAQVPHSDRWYTYFKKTYLKTASLMAKGARAAVILGGCKEGEIWKEIAYAYGRNIGIAFHLVDDILDFPSSAGSGEAGGIEVRLGVATAPLLFAAEEYPELERLISRRFTHVGDVERALSLIHASSGVQRTRELALAYAEKAKEVLGVLPPSDAREALEALTDSVMEREW